MSDGEKTSEQARRVRDHVRKVLSKLAALQEEKRHQERRNPKQDRG